MALIGSNFGLGGKYNTCLPVECRRVPFLSSCFVLPCMANDSTPSGELIHPLVSVQVRYICSRLPNLGFCAVLCGLPQGFCVCKLISGSFHISLGGFYL